MAHLNYCHTRVAGVNFCFIAFPSSDGCWYYVKCEMLLSKIDGKMNLQNCEMCEIVKWRRWRLMFHDWRQWQLPRTRTVVFRRDDTFRYQKYHRRLPVIPIGRSKCCKCCVYIPSDFTSFYIYEIATVAPWLMTTAVATDSRRRLSKRWHVADIKNISGDDQDWWKLRIYLNLCLLDQAKPLEKHLFFAARRPPLWCHFALFFPTITHNGFCSHLQKNNFSMTLTPPKNRDINIDEFFSRFYL